MTIEKLAKIVIFIWTSAGLSFFLYGWLNLPVLAIFTTHRIVEIRDSHFKIRPTLPNHAGLHFFCAFVYGLLLPAFYFISVRTRHELGPWLLGPNVNSWWTVGLGSVCMVWLLTHLLEAVRRGRRLQFSPTPANRLFVCAAALLCCWFHFHTIKNNLGLEPQSATEYFTLNLFFPQSFFLGTTLVYGMILREMFKKKPEFAEQPGVISWVFGGLVLLILYCPIWLSIPRMSHEQAMRLIESHRNQIKQTAEEANFDPRLLAGIIYVAQTRDHPRWTGDFIESLGLAIYKSQDRDFGSLINPSVGLGQMRIETAQQTSEILGLKSIGRILGRPSSFNSSVRSFDYRSFLSWAGPRTSDNLRKLVEQNCTLQNGLLNCLAESETNLALAALMLQLFREQWHAAGWSIDDRPEVLATLYNLGYACSRPHATPKPNDFGRRVKAFMESPACRSLFRDTDFKKHDNAVNSR